MQRARSLSPYCSSSSRESRPPPPSAHGSHARPSSVLSRLRLTSLFRAGRAEDTDDEAEDADSAGRPPLLNVRSLFISDVHLGTAGCQAEELLAFLKVVQCDNLFIVGDFIDGWELSSGRVFWPQSHSDVIQKLLKRARKGCKIMYLSGNHDEALRAYNAEDIEIGANIVIRNEHIHVTADGRRFLVMHGDRCDLTPHIRTDFNYMVKNHLYRAFQAFNRVVKWFRRRIGLPYFSLATAVNRNVNAAARLIRNYEAALAGEARCQGVDGVICGHIHHAAIREIEGVLYVNTGDWVDSLTAAVEHSDGRLECVRWLEMKAPPADHHGGAKPAARGKKEQKKLLASLLLTPGG